MNLTSRWFKMSSVMAFGVGLTTGTASCSGQCDSSKVSFEAFHEFYGSPAAQEGAAVKVHSVSFNEGEALIEFVDTEGTVVDAVYSMRFR